MKILSFLALAMTISVSFLSSVHAADSRLTVVTGNTIVQDIAVQIGGARVDATCLLQPGVDPHSYQPVPEDVKRLAAARLVIINGLGFEGWFEGLAKEAGIKGTVIVATKGIPTLKMEAEDDHAGHGHGHGHGHDHSSDSSSDKSKAHGQVDDPHAYNSIANGVRYAENIRDAFIAADVAGAEIYRASAAAYITQLRAADAAAKVQFASLTKAQRKLITNHDALQYFAHEYGFEILAPNTALEDSQPSAKDLAELIDFIKNQKVKGVFLEFGKNEKIIAQIAKEAGVTIGAELYLDGVGSAGSPAGTYLGMFQTNVSSIVAGLK